MNETDHYKTFLKNENVLVIFNGPHCYVSASWYVKKNIASTWNYMTVHAKGKLKLTDKINNDILEFEKVEFRIDERNIRSRKAVEKLGAALEGTLRSDTLMINGFRRNTCCYGILKEEWVEIKRTNFVDFK